MVINRSESIFAGDTFRLELPDDALHPQAEGWVLSVRLAGPATFSLTPTFTEGCWRLVHTTTNSWSAGAYVVLLEWTHAPQGRDSEDIGRLTVRSLPEADTLSQAERIVAAIDATLLGKATEDVRILEIAGRRLETFPPSELLQLREKYNDIATRERSRAQRTELPRRIAVRWRG